jgi:hypothetical protein
MEEDLIDQAPHGPSIAKLRYSHKAMVDMLIAEPWIKQGELARRFGMTQSWISTIINSDAFQVQLAERADQIIDPALRLSVQENFRGLMMRSMEILKEKLDKPAASVPDDLALRTFSAASRAAGYGAKTEFKVDIGVTTHIDQHGQQLVSLLRRKRAEVALEESVDGEVVKSSDKEGRACETAVRQVSADQQPELRSSPEAADAEQSGPPAA